MTRKPTANDMRRAMYRHFQQRWVLLPEVTARAATYGEKDRRIDILMLRRNAKFPGDWERMAVEIKVTRADFLSDIRQPEKQAPWRALAHRHAYAVPDGLVQLTEVPADSGLITVQNATATELWGPRVGFARRCPAGNQPEPTPQVLVQDAFYRAMRGEALRYGYGFTVADDADPDELRAQVARLKHDLSLAEQAKWRAQELVEEWRRRYARTEPPPCATCGAALYPATRGRGFLGGRWEHRDQQEAAACQALRDEAARTAHLATQPEQERFYWREDDWRHKVAPPAPDLEADPRQAAS